MIVKNAVQLRGFEGFEKRKNLGWRRCPSGLNLLLRPLRKVRGGVRNLSMK